MTLGTPTLMAGNSAATAQNYTTASVTPDAGALVLVFVVSGKASNLAEAATSVVHSAFGAMTKIATVPTPTNNLVLTVWKGIGTGVAGTFAISHVGTMDNCLWQLVKVTSTVATPTIRQIATDSTSPAGSFGASLPAACLSSSCTVGIMGHNSTDAGTTVGTGFTAIGSRISRSSPVVALWSEYDNSSPPQLAPFTYAAGSGKSAVTLEVADGTLAPAGPTAKLWNGSAEVDVTLSLWNGTAEVPVTLG